MQQNTSLPTQLYNVPRTFSQTSILKSAIKRNKSMPSKMVHFDSNLEKVKHFLYFEKPEEIRKPEFHWDDSTTEDDYSDDDDDRTILVSQEPTYRPTEWSSNMPKSFHINNKHKPVYLENLSFFNNKLIGNIMVQNLSFFKSVMVLYTTDNWRSKTEITADYKQSPSLQHDRFSFFIDTRSYQNLEFCIKFNCQGVDYYDNNDYKNYKVAFKRFNNNEHLYTFSPKNKRPLRSKSVSSANPPQLFAHNYTYQPPKTKETANPSQKHDFDFNTKSYQDLINSYCFFTTPSIPSC